MKLIQKLCTLCLVFVLSSIMLTGCNSSKALNTTLNKKPTTSTTSATGGYAVTFSSYIDLEYDSNTAITVEDSCIIFKTNTKIKPLLKNSKTVTFSGFFVNGKYFDCDSEIFVTENLTITSFEEDVKPVGFLIYQNAINNSSWNNISNFETCVPAQISITNESIKVTDKFLFYIYKSNTHSYSSNSKMNFNHSETHLSFELELYLETTQIYSMIIFEDLNGDLHYKSLGFSDIDFENTNLITINNLKCNTYNNITNITLEFSNNISTTKK